MKSIITFAIALIVVVFVRDAAAMGFELSAGKTSNTNGGSYSAAVTGYVAEGWKLRVGYGQLGSPKFDLRAPASAAWDDVVLAGKPAGQYYFLPMKRNAELFITLAPEWTIGDLTYSLELGIGRYKPQWQDDYLPGVTGIAPHTSRTNYTPIIGASVGIGNIALALIAQNINYWGDWEGNAPKSETYTLALRYGF